MTQQTKRSRPSVLGIFFLLSLFPMSWSYLAAGPIHPARVQLDQGAGRLECVDPGETADGMVLLRRFSPDDHALWERGIRAGSELRVENVALGELEIVIIGSCRDWIDVNGLPVALRGERTTFFMVLDALDGTVIRHGFIKEGVSPVSIRMGAGGPVLVLVQRGRTFQVSLDSPPAWASALLVDPEDDGPERAFTDQGGPVIQMVEDTQGAIVDPNGPPN